MNKDSFTLVNLSFFLNSIFFKYAPLKMAKNIVVLLLLKCIRLQEMTSNTKIFLGPLSGPKPRPIPRRP